MNKYDIVPEQTKNIPHEARKGLREIIETFEIHQNSRQDFILLDEKDNVLIRIEKYEIDFNMGEEIVSVEIETPKIRTQLKARNVSVTGTVITFYGYREQEYFRIFI